MDNRKRHFHIKLDNRGFSLVELLISMVILILIMIPLMDNFMQSARINSEADKLQEYSNIAADVAEDMKTRTLNALPADYIRKYKQSDGSYSSTQDPTVTDDKSYYIYTDGTNYDALITVNADKYKYEGDKHGGTLFNNYKMPKIDEVDELVNGLFFTNVYKDIQNNQTLTNNQLFTQLKTITAKKDDEIVELPQSDIATALGSTIKCYDQLALDYFVAEAENYADQQFQATTEYDTYRQKVKDYENGKITGYPTQPTRSADDSQYYYCQEDNVSGMITRTSQIKVSLNGSTTIINYQIFYECAWPAGINISSKSLTNQIAYKQYSSVNNVYLFYKKSLFQEEKGLTHQDKISITNSRSDSINFYLIRQGADSVDTQKSVLIGSDNKIDNVKFYTNMPDNIAIDSTDSPGFTLPSPTDKKVVVESAPENRIYTVNVAIYKHQDADPAAYPPADKLYSLDSIINHQ